MPLAFSCPSCAQVLKIPDAMAGRKGKCPKCGAVVQVPAARQPAGAAIQAKALPRSQRPAVAAEIDRDDREAEAEVQERPKKKRKTKKSPVLLLSLLGVGCGGLFFICSGAGVLAWWFFFTGGLGDELKYMPDNSQFVASIRVEQFLQSEVFQELRREFPQIDKEMKQDMIQERALPADEIESMVVGGSGLKEIILVMRTKKAVNAADLRARNKSTTYTETRVGKYLMQESVGDSSRTFCVVESKMIVAGETAAVRKVLTRDKKPEFSKNLQAAMKQTDFSKTIALAVDLKAGPSRPAAGAGDLPFLGGGANMLGGLDKAEALAVQIKVGSDVRFETTILCPDAKSAEDMKKAIDGILVLSRGKQGVPKEFDDLLDIPLKVDGNKVTASKSFKVGPLLKAYKQKGGNF